MKRRKIRHVIKIDIGLLVVVESPAQQRKLWQNSLSDPWDNQCPLRFWPESECQIIESVFTQFAVVKNIAEHNQVIGFWGKINRIQISLDKFKWCPTTKRVV